ncbi:hypothetical protein [Limosilactobacillus reuteri]|uniref:hypothetical protein n=1 Tax=Limosilactobacillus reuteri TaxID=1598 RepID=UPI001E51DFE1|nr:hypothetical protein [Limosilactobacillus reuteri]MCC4358003.1 hypothetical protein [Limosilactobacillus reuteri]MCC4363045.1 hypothetical protein [Limosilactobacillus reuteri]MCC4365157.1 hypothetical protein [Limosilactobacillus reuteri]
MIKEPTLEDFKNYLIISVVKDIVTIDKKSPSESLNQFQKSKTYKLIQNMGNEYDEVGPDYFYDLYKNELKYGEPITSDALYLKKNNLI